MVCDDDLGELSQTATRFDNGGLQKRRDAAPKYLMRAAGAELTAKPTLLRQLLKSEALDVCVFSARQEVCGE